MVVDWVEHMTDYGADDGDIVGLAITSNTESDVVKISRVKDDFVAIVLLSDSYGLCRDVWGGDF